MSNKNNKHTKGWGGSTEDGTEMWDARPLFEGPSVTRKDWAKLLFYPKKRYLYRYIDKHAKQVRQERNLHAEPYRILDIGCGTGATAVDFKKMFGRECEVVGLDVIQLQIDIAKRRVKEFGVNAEFFYYDGHQFPFSDNTFDAVYTSDVLGHVENVPFWMDEINRVIRPGGVLAMFSESKLGKHAYLRNWFMKHGLNTDPHEEFHISLYSKQELKELVLGAGFDITDMLASVWNKFFVHPDELRPALKKNKLWKFLPFKLTNAILAWTKKNTHPVSTAACELYSLIEMKTIGKWVESQGYVILAKTRKK